MSGSPRLLTRIAVFSALIYVLSWGTSYLVNVNLAFFIAFSAGFIWGAGPGIAVGAMGMFLWTSFNPFGPAAPPVAIAQVIGLAGCGLVGFLSRRMVGGATRSRSRVPALLAAALICTLVFYVPVNLVDAWVFQPFWPRFISGSLFMGISLVANFVIFPIFFGVTSQIRERERAVQW